MSNSNDFDKSQVVGWNWDYTKPFFYRIQVDHSAIDALNHANNGSYVVWCEAAAWAHSLNLGLNIENFQQLDRAIAVRHAEYDYLKSTYLDDTLIVGTWLSDVSRSRMHRMFQFIREADHATVLRAKWTLVCIEMSTSKIKRLPEVFYKIYSKE